MQSTGCAVASTFLRMPADDLLEFVQLCPREKLVEIYRLGLVCRCEPPEIWQDPGGKVGLGLRVVNCGRGGVPIMAWVPCPHLPENMLPVALQGIVLARLWPKKYAEPPLDQRGSSAITYRDCLRVRIGRARRGRQLFHPRDRQQPNADGLADALGIKMRTKRSGDIIEEGIVRLADGR